VWLFTYRNEEKGLVQPTKILQ